MFGRPRPNDSDGNQSGASAHQRKSQIFPLTKRRPIPKLPGFNNMAEPKQTDRMEKIVSLCKRRGFIFQSSEIYGGINGFWDYGPLGAELKRSVKE
jgi:hypothetical protein